MGNLKTDTAAAQPNTTPIGQLAVPAPDPAVLEAKRKAALVSAYQDPKVSKQPLHNRADAIMAGRARLSSSDGQARARAAELKAFGSNLLHGRVAPLPPFVMMELEERVLDFHDRKTASALPKLSVMNDEQFVIESKRADLSTQVVLFDAKTNVATQLTQAPPKPWQP